MYSVITRFRLKHFWHIFPFYLDYWMMQQILKKTPGLIRYAFLFESPRTFYTLSLWESEEAIREFTNVRDHIEVLRKSKRLCQTIWSAYWSLDALSKFASDWPGEKPWPSFMPHPRHPHRLIPDPLTGGRMEEAEA
jgi:hypothetical protein